MHTSGPAAGLCWSFFLVSCRKINEKSLEICCLRLFRKNYKNVQVLKENVKKRGLTLIWISAVLWHKRTYSMCVISTSLAVFILVKDINTCLNFPPAFPSNYSM